MQSAMADARPRVKEMLKALHGEWPKHAAPLIVAHDLLKKRATAMAAATAAERTAVDAGADEAEVALIWKLHKQCEQIVLKYESLARLSDDG